MRAALFAGALTVLFVLRTFGVSAHVALEHGDGHSDPREHSHPVEGEHPVEDHLPDLLADRLPEPQPIESIGVDQGRLLAPLVFLCRLVEPRPVQRPRARSPAPPCLRGPPNV